jgi:hypothetical protein
MVVQKWAGFCELQNTMDLSEEEKHVQKSGDKKVKSVSETVGGRGEETVETLQSAFLKFKRNRQVSV